MDNSIDNLPKQIKNSNIDIEALNEFIQQGEKESFLLNEEGEIISSESNNSFLSKIYNLIKKILN